MSMLGCLLSFNVLLYYKEDGFESVLGTRLLKIGSVAFMIILFLLYLLWDYMTRLANYLGWRQTKMDDYFPKKKLNN